MTAVVLATPAWDADAFAEFLDEQQDLGPKQRPRYRRICADLPQTATFKVLTRALAEEGVHCSDPVWERRGTRYHPL